MAEKEIKFSAILELIHYNNLIINNKNFLI